MKLIKDTEDFPGAMKLQRKHIYSRRCPPGYTPKTVKMIDSNYFVVLICFLLVYGLFKKLQRRQAFPLPPGPPGEPLIGHLRVYPRTHDTYLKWHKLYGDIVHFSVLGQPIIVLNTEQAANDLLQKRGKIYSERPYMPMHDMIGWGEMLTFLNTGDAFNKARKLLQDPFTQPKCITFQEMQLSLTHLLLKSMLSNPTDFNAHLKRFTTAVVVEIAYGHRILSDDDKHAEIIEAVNHVLAIGGDLGTSPVDLLPILRHLPSWFPGAWFIQYAKEANVVATALINNPFDEVLSKLANGTAPDCFTTIALETMKNDHQETDEDMRRLKNAASALHSAGSDTTWGTLKTFVLLMVLYPDKQRKAQDELDTVLGGDRLPNFSDRDSLPYLECVLWETMRWHPVVPLGVPHRNSEDDVYRGFHIPKNSTIIPNTRCITMDEAIYHNPSEFSPERFLPYPEGRNEPRTNAVFGYGRRICPGRYLAEANVWIAMANLLTVFNFSPIKDADGIEQMPNAEFYDSFLGYVFQGL